MIEAIARAAGVPGPRSGRPDAAGRPRPGGRGRPGLGRARAAQFRLEVGRPPADAGLDRAQHRRGHGAGGGGRGRVEAGRPPHPGPPGRDRGGVFTRTSTTSPPGCPRWWRPPFTLPVGTAVLDGEVIALQPDGGPPVPGDGQPGRQPAGRGAAGRRRSTCSLFDLLHLDGQDLLDQPGAERHAAMAWWSLRTCASRARSLPTRPRPPASWTTPWPAATRAWSSRPWPPPGRPAAAALQLAQGQAGPHPRPGRAGRRVGPRPISPGLHQPPPGRP